MSTTSTTTETHSLHTNPYISLSDAMESLKRQLAKWMDAARQKHPDIRITGHSHAVHKEERGLVVSALFTVEFNA